MHEYKFIDSGIEVLGVGLHLTRATATHHTNAVGRNLPSTRPVLTTPTLAGTPGTRPVITKHQLRGRNLHQDLMLTRRGCTTTTARRRRRRQQLNNQFENKSVGVRDYCISGRQSWERQGSVTRDEQGRDCLKNKKL